mmetsp:Transcript_29437/g.78408  ORF Transcript_29437/g.78408 Transcript_29437/m.78408 type:complete len:358 (+) Transcript_29437:532-1605(+)
MHHKDQQQDEDDNGVAHDRDHADAHEEKLQLREERQKRAQGLQGRESSLRIPRPPPLHLVLGLRARQAIRGLLGLQPVEQGDEREDERRPEKVQQGEEARGSIDDLTFLRDDGVLDQLASHVHRQHRDMFVAVAFRLHHLGLHQRHVDGACVHSLGGHLTSHGLQGSVQSALGGTIPCKAWLSGRDTEGAHMHDVTALLLDHAGQHTQDHAQRPEKVEGHEPLEVVEPFPALILRTAPDAAAGVGHEDIHGPMLGQDLSDRTLAIVVVGEVREVLVRLATGGPDLVSDDLQLLGGPRNQDHACACCCQPRRQVRADAVAGAGDDNGLAAHGALQLRGRHGAAEGALWREGGRLRACA